MTGFAGALVAISLGAITWTMALAAENVIPPVHNCDRLAASPYDMHAVAPPVSEVNFDAGKALRACRAALGQYPDTARFESQLARALDGAGQEQEAVEWYRKAAEQGHVHAMAALGQKYDEGAGVAKHGREAAAWLWKASENGSPLGQVRLGAMYAQGGGVTKDEDRAAKLFQKAVAWFRDTAEQGVAEAQSWLGWMYRQGYGVPQDDGEAVKWSRMAAEQGLPLAQYWLGRMYAEGRGVTKDDAEAISWFRKAAEQDLSNAQAWLGSVYALGQGVPQDYATAFEWLQKAAAQDDAGAQNWLGWMYVEGKGVPQDYALAAGWFRKAAEQGVTQAQHWLGWLYAAGKGVAQDHAEAAKWYRKAAEQGSAEAQAALENLGTATAKQGSTREWIADHDTGCKASWSDVKPGQSIRWSGKCTEGKATGAGRLTFYQDGVAIFGYNVGENYGVTVNGGLFSTNVNTGDLNNETIRCKNSVSSWINYKADIDSRLDVINWPVTVALVRQAEQNARKLCEGKLEHDCVDISLTLRRQGEAVITARNGGRYLAGEEERCNILGGPNRLENIAFDRVKKAGWRQHKDELARRKAEAARVAALEQRRRRQQEQERRRQAEAERARQEAAAEAAVKASTRKAFDAFMEEAGAEEWVEEEKLVANPFIYEDKVLLVWIKFSTMVARDQALFHMGNDAFLISDVPLSAFTHEGDSVLLAGRVAGKEYVKLPVVGDVLVPHLEYVDAHLCQQPRCDEMLAWARGD